MHVAGGHLGASISTFGGVGRIRDAQSKYYACMLYNTCFLSFFIFGYLFLFWCCPFFGRLVLLGLLSIGISPFWALSFRVYMMT